MPTPDGGKYQIEAKERIKQRLGQRQSFNSNWFDYSLVRSELQHVHSKVSIPTGSITVLGQLGSLLFKQLFQFQLVRLQCAGGWRNC